MNEVTTYLWYEWQARILEASIPLIRLLPAEEQTRIFHAILGIVQDNLPW